MDITTEHRELLKQIQDLALAAAGQTGYAISHRVSLQPGILSSTVQVNETTPEGYECTDLSVSSVTEFGQLLPTDTTLEGQRDWLAGWIIQHRKGEAA